MSTTEIPPSPHPATAPAVEPAPAGHAAVALRAAAARVLTQLRGALTDAAPRHRYQRVMYAVAVLMLASGVAHVGVWAVDGGAWEGAVSWRKPILFGV